MTITHETPSCRFETKGFQCHSTPAPVTSSPTPLDLNRRHKYRDVKTKKCHEDLHIELIKVRWACEKPTPLSLFKTRQMLTGVTHTTCQATSMDAVSCPESLNKKLHFKAKVTTAAYANSALKYSSDKFCLWQWPI